MHKLKYSITFFKQFITTASTLLHCLNIAYMSAQADFPSSFTICTSMHNYFVTTPIHAVQVYFGNVRSISNTSDQVYKEDGTTWLTFDMETQRRDYEKFSEWIR